MCWRMILSFCCSFVLALLTFMGISFADMREWTLLAYMNGMNSTDSYAIEAVNQLEEVGSTGEINVVVQLGSYSAGTVQRFFVQRDFDSTRITSQLLDDVSGTDMGDWRNLLDFIRWGIANYPAKHYFILVRGPSPPSRGGWYDNITADEGTGNRITAEELGCVMEKASCLLGRKIDILGADSNHVAMVEIAEQLSESVDILIASQEQEPITGWKYDRFLAKWAITPQMSPEQVARLVTYEYKTAYNGKCDATLSALNLNQIGILNVSLKAVARHLSNLMAPETEVALRAAVEARRFGTNDYADLIDFLRRLQMSAVKGNFEDPDFLRKILIARNAAENMILSNGTAGACAHANGISIWLPLRQDLLQTYLFRYRLLDFDKHTSWSYALYSLLP